MKEKTVKKILAATPSLYNKIAVDFNQTRNKPWPITDLIKSYVNGAKNVIDVGCGSGRLSELIAPDQNYLGVDNSKELIKIAQNKYYNRKNINFQVKDIINDQLPENTFDLAIFIAVIHHLPTTKLRLEVLKNIHQALSSNGLVIVTSWNLWQRRYRHQLLNYKSKFLTHGILNVNDAFIPWKINGQNEYRYVHSFGKKELHQLLIAAGFKVQTVFFEQNGQPVSRFQGKNIVAIAQKI